MNLSAQSAPEVSPDCDEERALRDEIAELEIANRALADFAALLSHDLAGALRRVVGMAELLRLTPASDDDPHTLAFLRTILSSARKVQNRIEQSLTVDAKTCSRTHP